MARLIFYAVILVLFARAMWRLWQGVRQGMGHETRGGSGVPQRGVPMSRDPICGTFVIPDKSLALVAGGQSIYFCSPTCRDKYRASSNNPATGRTA